MLKGGIHKVLLMMMFDIYTHTHHVTARTAATRPMVASSTKIPVRLLLSHLTLFLNYEHSGIRNLQYIISISPL